MVEQIQNIVPINPMALLANARSEGEVNDIMEEWSVSYQHPMSKITDAEAGQVFRAAKTKLHLLRLHGSH